MSDLRVPTLPAHSKQILNYPEHAKEISTQKPLRDLDPNLDVDSAPKMEYHKRTERSCAHRGQLKLCANELRFLRRFASDSCFVVYAGAGPGNHIPTLIAMFPRVTWALYDPAGFSPRLKPTSKVWLFAKFFTETECERYAAMKSPVLFICDIRTCKPATGDPKIDAEIPKYIAEDMERQQNWVRMMKPRASMLKFRLPWGAGVTEYLSGEIWLQPFAPLTSTETRLVVTDPTSVRVYDNQDYERAMMFHNTISRCQQYRHKFRKIVKGFCGCFDCSLLVKICGNHPGDTPRGVEETLKAVLRGCDVHSLLGGKTSSSQGTFRPRSYRGDKFQEL